MSEQPELQRSDETRLRPRLAFAPVASIERLPEGERWVVDDLVSGSSLTVLGAAPKTGKTWVCLGLAVAVATGTQAMGRYQVGNPGRVLLLHAEDDPRSIRERIESLCAGQHLQLTEDLPVDVITEESLKLDNQQHREMLEELIRQRGPRLVVLDPLVRLHTGPESSSSHMAELFGYLRTLTRRYQISIVVTHHLAKNRATGGAQLGQALRGSGDIHAAYDHGLALVRREDGTVLMRVEHRAAASPEPVAYRLVSKPGRGIVFEFVPVEAGEEQASAPLAPKQPQVSSAAPLSERVLEFLRAAEGPLSQVAIRSALRVRNAALSEVLHGLLRAGKIHNLGRMGGWVLGETKQAEDAS